jgi:hypothetical protein
VIDKTKSKAKDYVYYQPDANPTKKFVANGTLIVLKV